MFFLTYFEMECTSDNWITKQANAFGEIAAPPPLGNNAVANLVPEAWVVWSWWGSAGLSWLYNDLNMGVASFLKKQDVTNNTYQK